MDSLGQIEDLLEMIVFLLFINCIVGVVNIIGMI
jgi:hypothetical protein